MGKYNMNCVGRQFNGGRLVVIDGGDKDGYVKVKCIVCAEDSELFGDAVFERQIHSLVSGRLPCGCSKKTFWSLDQYKVKIERKIKDENLPIEFRGFIEVGKPPGETPIKLFCKRDCVEYTVDRVEYFFAGRGNMGKFYKFSERLDEYNIQNPSHTVWDTGKFIRNKSNKVCGFHCSICESNGFESVFETMSSRLFSGILPCFCYNKKNISGEHVLELSRRKLYEQGLKGIDAIGVYRKGRHWFTTFLCEVHGAYSRAFSSLKKTGCHCLRCNPPASGYNTTKQGFLYLLDIQTQAKIILGYGITNSLDARISKHKFNLKSIGAIINSIRVFEGSGAAVLDVENAIKSLHTTGLLDCEGFRRESIDISKKSTIVEKCMKLKEITLKENL